MAENHNFSPQKDLYRSVEEELQARNIHCSYGSFEAAFCQDLRDWGLVAKRLWFY